MTHPVKLKGVVSKSCGFNCGLKEGSHTQLMHIPRAPPTSEFSKRVSSSSAHIITRIAEHAIIYIPKQFPHHCSALQLFSKLLMNSSPGGIITLTLGARQQPRGQHLNHSEICFF